MNGGKRVFLILVVLSLIMLSAGCTMFPAGSTQKSSETVSSGYPAGYAGGSYDADSIREGSSAPLPTPAPTLSSGPDQAIDQKIVYTATLSLEVADVPVAIDSLKSIAAAKGGYVSSSSMYTGTGGRKTATVSLRVPAKEFEAALAGVKGIGTVLSVSSTGEDVTAEYVDLMARKTSYQNQIAQYNEIMKKSEKVEDIITVQEQLDRVQTDLDRLEGKLRYMNNRIDLSTITVSLKEPEPVGGETSHSFISTLNEGIQGLIGMIDFLIIAFLTLIPLIIVVCAGYFVYRGYQGAKGRKGAK
jgi:hypothetical protein